jgi:uncharacterized protein YsxB (DUF464 family)
MQVLWGCKGFSVVCAVISLMILQLIFTIPQVIAKLLNYSDTDFGTGNASTKTEGYLNTRMGGGAQSGGSPQAELGKKTPQVSHPNWT